MASPVKVLNRVRIVNLLLSLLGIGLSAYSVYVGYKKGQDSKYKAYCDINPNVQCSRVLNSKYSKGFGILGSLIGEDSPFIVSNGIYGIAFYAIVMILGQLNYSFAAHLQRIIVFLSNGASIYLAYILFFVLKDICVVCISTYVINFLLTIFAFVRVSYQSSKGGKAKKGKQTNQKQTQGNQKSQKDQKKAQNQQPQGKANKQNAKQNNKVENKKVENQKAAITPKTPKKDNSNKKGNKDNKNTKKNK